MSSRRVSGPEDYSGREQVPQVCSYVGLLLEIQLLTGEKCDHWLLLSKTVFTSRLKFPTPLFLLKVRNADCSGLKKIK